MKNAFELTTRESDIQRYLINADPLVNILLHAKQRGFDTFIKMDRKRDRCAALEFAAFASAFQLKNFKSVLLRILPDVPSHQKRRKVSNRAAAGGGDDAAILIKKPM